LRPGGLAPGFAAPQPLLAARESALPPAPPPAGVISRENRLIVAGFTPDGPDRSLFGPRCAGCGPGLLPMGATRSHHPIHAPTL